MLIAVMGMFAMSACGDDDDDVKPGNLPAGVENAMKVQFPNAQNVKWEKKGAYVVADFIDARSEKEAWFTNDAKLAMTETDYGKDLFYLPSVVEKSFSEGEYGTWIVDDIDFYERTDKDFYLIEVEKAGQREMDLYFSPDGVLIKAVPDSDVEITPDTVI